MRTRTARLVSVAVAGTLVATAGVLLSPAGASYGDVAQFDTGSGSNPVGIVAAGDGTLWYTDRGLNVVGHMQPDGSLTTFDLPTPNAGPWGVVVGPDGAIWFTERAGDGDGREACRPRSHAYRLPPAGAGAGGARVGGGSMFDRPDSEGLSADGPSGAQ